MCRFFIFTTILIVTVGAAFAQERGLADLVVSTDLAVNVDATETGPLRGFRPGQFLLITGNVRNIGTARASTPVIALEVNGMIAGQQRLDNLMPDASRPFSFRWRPTAAGRQVIRVSADLANRIRESNEMNNAAVVVVTLTRSETAGLQVRIDTAFDTQVSDTRPVESSRDTPIARGAIDLKMDGVLSMTGARARVGRPGSVLRFVVRNQGQSAVRNVNVELRANGEVAARQSLGTIPANRNRNVAINWRPLVAGPQTLTVVIDPDNHVAESDEANNTGVTSVNVSER